MIFFPPQDHKRYWDKSNGGLFRFLLPKQYQIMDFNPNDDQPITFRYPPPSQEQPADLWMGAGTILFAELPSQDAFLLSSLKLKTISSLKHLN